MSSHRGGVRLRVVDLLLLLLGVVTMVAGSAVAAYRSAAREGVPSSSSTPSSSGAASGRTLESAAARVLRSVVSISAVGRTQRVDGAGVLIRADGTILTADHLVADVAANGGQVTVTLADGRTSPAVVLGQSAADDVAVVRATRWHGLQPAALALSSELRVGQQVIVVGNPLGEAETVTAGIVSALNRTEGTDPASSNGSTVPPPDPDVGRLTLHGLIQTDAHVNPGSSGGALADLTGDVIGLVVMSRTPTGEGEGSVGIGFAIPIAQAYTDAQRLLARAAH